VFALLRRVGPRPLRRDILAGDEEVDVLGDVGAVVPMFEVLAMKSKCAHELIMRGSSIM
jgi:hypothetical protein